MGSCFEGVGLELLFSLFLMLLTCFYGSIGFGYECQVYSFFVDDTLLG